MSNSLVPEPVEWKNSIAV